MTATETTHVGADRRPRRDGSVALSAIEGAHVEHADQSGAGTSVAPSSPDPGHHGVDLPGGDAGSGDPLAQQPAITRPEPRLEALTAGAFSNDLDRPADDGTTPIAASPAAEAFDLLRTLAECFWDAQEERKRLANRMRSGMVPEDVSKAVLDAQGVAEHELKKAMVKAFRRTCPELVAWAKETTGVGEHLLARLIGTTGHPVIARPFHWHNGEPPEDHVCDPLRCKKDAQRHLVADPPFVRNVAKWRAYCGVGDPTRKRRKGMSVDEAARLGNPRAKTIVYLLALSALKEGGRSVEALEAQEQTPDEAMWPYRRVFEEARLHYWLTRPEWTPGHQNNAAIRIVGKEILKDIWIAARRAIPSAPPERQAPGGLGSASGSHPHADTQGPGAVAGDSRWEAGQ